MAKSATKSGNKAGATKPVIRPLYAVPINECAASGNLREMKSMAAQARKHVADVQAALAKLEQAMAKAGNKAGNG